MKWSDDPEARKKADDARTRVEIALTEGPKVTTYLCRKEIGGTDGPRRARELRKQRYGGYLLLTPKLPNPPGGHTNEHLYILSRPPRTPVPPRPVQGVQMGDDFDPARVTWVLTTADVAHLVAALDSCSEVVMDLETTGTAEHAWRGGPQNGGVAARVVLASFTLPTRGDQGRPDTWLLPLSHPESPLRGRWRAVLGRVAAAVARKPLINANVKFDCRWVHAHTGVDLSRVIVWDTQVSSHLLDENASTRLKARAPATFGIPPWDDFDLSTPGAAERVPLMDLGLYAARDTYWTWRLAELHRRVMFLSADTRRERPEGPEEVEDARLGLLATYCAMPTVATLTAVEQRGILLDRDWVETELVDRRDRVAVLTAELAERYGADPDGASFVATSTWFLDWAENAVAQGDLVVAEMTPTGRPRWSKAVLVRQSRAGSKVAARLLELRSAAKQGEYLASWLTWQARDGAIHATYHAGRVVTGRLSSADPNMQQVTSGLKPAFVPRPGYVFADLDYSQIELRVAAFISRCAPMIEAFRRDDDLHRLLASRITGKPPAEITPVERYGGKSANFGLLYGMSAPGFREYAENVYDVSYTLDEAAAMRDAFFATWVGIEEWHAATLAKVRRTGQVSSPIGRVRRLPDITAHSDYLVGAAERAAINSPVQGFASDLMQMAAASIEGTLPGVDPVAGASIVGTVHDSILAEVPEDDWQNVTLECQARMTSIPEYLTRLDCDFDVPLVAAATVGTRWGQSDVGQL